MENPFNIKSNKVSRSRSLESLIKLCIQSVPKTYVDENENTTRFRLALKINQISNPPFTPKLASMVLNPDEQDWVFIYRDIQCLINCANQLGGKMPKVLEFPITIKTSYRVYQPYVAYFSDLKEFRIIQ
jgi:hypothetical protein